MRDNFSHKIIFLFFPLLLVLVIGGLLIFTSKKILSPLGSGQIITREKPFEKYTFENLRKTSFPKTPVTLGPAIKDDPQYSSQLFFFQAQGKKVSGLINIPKKSGSYPIIVLFRGFVPKDQYFSGNGTQHAGEVFAKNGFITLAPDFLGYGQSDNPSDNSIEERFQTYTTALTSLSSLSNLNSGLEASYSGKIQANAEKVGIWGHSNGGQIALSVLAISGKEYPTVLWAPVSKPFPFSILFYTDDFDDHGKALRGAIAQFEKDYDSELYSPPNYYNWIKAPIALHQGTADESVPIWWSNQLYETLKKQKLDITYYTYPGDDHNLSPNGWSAAVARSIEFYKKHFAQ